MKSFISVSGTARIATDGTTTFPNDLYNQVKTCIEIMKKVITSFLIEIMISIKTSI